MPDIRIPKFKKWLAASPPVEWALASVRGLLINAIKQGPVPQHVAFVMDGNRRFAKKSGTETLEGHSMGFEALARILEVCYKSGVKVVTIYAFSIENFKRSQYEVDGLMELAKSKLLQILQHGDLLDRYGIGFRVLGNLSLLREDVLQAFSETVALTATNDSAILNVCFPYTSREEIATAVRETVVEFSKPLPQTQGVFSERHIMRGIRQRRLSHSTSKTDSSPPSLSRSPTSSTPSEHGSSMSSSTTLHQNPSSLHDLFPLRSTSYPDPESISAASIAKHLYTAGNPPLDLFVRTSGVERLSDFMLWQITDQTEIAFLDCLWPEFDLWSFLPVLLEWQRTKRKAAAQKLDP